MNKRNILLLLFVFEIALITCFGYASGHYSTDDYNIMNIGYDRYSVINNLKEGRPIMYLIDQLALRVNLSYDLFIKLTVTIAIFFTSLAVVWFFNIIKKYFKNNTVLDEFILLLISYTIFFNFMYIENLYFVESIVMSLCLLLYLISANYFVERKHVVLCVILAIGGTFCYNGFQCAYITLVLVLSLLKNGKNYKKIIIDILLAGLIIILSVLCNLIQVKLVCELYDMNNSRLGSLSNIINNIIFIIYKMPTILTNTVGLFPKYCYLIFIMAIYILTFINARKTKNYRILLEVSLTTLVSILSCFCIFLVTLSSFETGRLLYGIGMTTGLLFLLLMQCNKSYWKKIFTILFIAYFIINIFNIVYMIDLHKQVNNLEKSEVLQLEEYIKAYEETEKCTVDKIACIINKNANNLFYSRITRYNVITNRALACKWSCVGVVNYYTNRNLKEIECTEEIINFYNTADTDKNNGIICYKDILICPISIW